MQTLVLKTDLIACGVQLAPDMARRLGSTALPPSLDLVLPDGVSASVPVLADATVPARYRLAGDDRHATVEHTADGDPLPGRVDVRLYPIPRFYAGRTSLGTPMRHIAERRGRVLLVTPSGRCGFSSAGTPCAFCIEGGGTAGRSASAATPGEVLEVVRAAQVDGPVDVLLFNSDVFDRDDGGLGFLAPYIQVVRRHLHALVALQIHPPRTAAWVDRTYALGVDAVSYSLEIFDAGTFNRLCIGRARYVGHDRYLHMLERATGIFPRGAVWSELVLGIEPIESTLRGLEVLADLGVVPVLAIARASNGRPRRGVPADVARAVTHLRHVMQTHDVPLTWVREVGTAITPLEIQHVSRAGASFVGTVANALGNGLARLSARPLARVRRRLRVRIVAPDAADH